jgi:hypothetical protein
MKQGKKLGLVRTFELLKAGKNPSQISKDLSIPKQTINYYVDKLRKRGYISKSGYGVWVINRDLKEVPILTSRPLTWSNKKVRTSKQIRGHAFIWKIEFFTEVMNWEKYLKIANLPYQKISSDKVFRIIFKNKKIWLTSKGMIIYEALDFLGDSSFQVKGSAVFEMDLLVKDLLKKLNLKFLPYKFTTSREHYGIIKNELARQYNDKKEKLYIKGDDGDIWLWIDDSLSLGEMENKEPVVNRQVQNWWNDNKKHNFEVTPSFTLEAIKGLTENQIYMDRNVVKHFEVLNKLGNAVDELRKEIKHLTVSRK